MELAARRLAYARDIVARAGLRSPRLAAAFAAVPREAFLGPPPWQMLGAGGSFETADPALLYQDLLVELGAAPGLNNGQPSLHALALAAADPRPGETALQIGAGGGYYSALLAELLRPGGRLIAYEIEPALAARAAAALRPAWPEVELRAGSACAGALPAADLIYASAGASHPPRNWLQALRPGGRLVFPLTADNGHGLLLRLRRESATRYEAQVLDAVSFVPCEGARDAASAARLRQALAHESLPALRALHLGSPSGEACWLAGEGWWLEQAF